MESTDLVTLRIQLRALYFNATFDIITSLFGLGISFQMPEPAPQLCKTASFVSPFHQTALLMLQERCQQESLRDYFPAPAFLPYSGDVWQSLRYSARNTIHCLKQKWEVTMFNFIWALCSWKVATGSRNPFTFCSPFGIQELANQLTAKTSALADSERCR